MPAWLRSVSFQPLQSLVQCCAIPEPFHLNSKMISRGHTLNSFGDSYCWTCFRFVSTPPVAHALLCCLGFQGSVNYEYKKGGFSLLSWFFFSYPSASTDRQQKTLRTISYTPTSPHTSIPTLQNPHTQASTYQTNIRASKSSITRNTTPLNISYDVQCSAIQHQPPPFPVLF